MYKYRDDILYRLREPGSLRLALYARWRALGMPARTPSFHGPVRTPQCSVAEDAPRTEPRISTAVVDGAVPPIVFQTWKTKQFLPGNFAHWSQSFTRHNPGYQHLIWNDSDNRAFVEEHF